MATGIYQLPAGFRLERVHAARVRRRVHDRGLLAAASAINEQRILLYTGRPEGHLQLQERGPAPGQGVPHPAPAGPGADRAQVFNLFNSDNYTGYQQFIPPLPEVNANFGEPTREDPKRRFQFGVVVSLLSVRCVAARSPPRPLAAAVLRVRAPRHAPARGRPLALPALFDDVQARTFRFFWERHDPRTGLVPDRWPQPRPSSSIAAVGFALTAYPIGVERGYVTRAAARGARADDAALLRRRAAGPGARRAHRPSRVLLPLPRHGDRPARRRRTSSCRPSTPRCCWPGCSSASRTSTGAGPRRRRSASSPSASTAAWTGTGPRRGPPIVSMGWRPEVGHYPLGVARSTTRR